jgi:putative hydrolase of the HAD superfamily
VSLWIYTDADNTLWDTDALFAEAQLALLQSAERQAGRKAPTPARLDFVRQYDQAIAARHHAKLRYPPALLLRALQQGLQAVPAERAATQVLAEGSIPVGPEVEALEIYSKTLSAAPPALTGVRQGMQLAHRHGHPIYVISEGPLESLRARLRALDLESSIAGALSATKSADLYARLLQRAAPNRAVMIGDQPDRDIQLAHEAGLKTILIESRFKPRWTKAGDASGADAIATNFLDAIQRALRWSLEPSASS